MSILDTFKKLMGVKPVDPGDLNRQATEEQQVLHYTIVNLQQGTKEWREWRRHGSGAADAPAIMGENPWKSAEYLLQEKCEGRRCSSNAAMARGMELEPVARERYEAKIGIRVVPTCLQSLKYEWLRASVDGLATDGNTIVEIKCGESVYRKASASRKVPDYYYGQLQHMLAITNLQSIDFFCYWPKRPEVHLRIARDDSYIERLLDAEYKFWQKVLITSQQFGTDELPD